MDAFATHPETVIVVDDDPELLRALRFSLELEGFAVETHERGDGIDAAALPTSGACLVIDYLLPGGVNGLDLLKALRDRGVTLPAILITTHAGRAIRGLACTLGASVVEKPLLGPGLVAEIRALMPTTEFRSAP